MKFCELNVNSGVNQRIRNRPRCDSGPKGCRRRSAVVQTAGKNESANPFRGAELISCGPRPVQSRGAENRCHAHGLWPVLQLLQSSSIRKKEAENFGNSLDAKKSGHGRKFTGN